MKRSTLIVYHPQDRSLVSSFAADLDFRRIRVEHAIFQQLTATYLRDSDETMSVVILVSRDSFEDASLVRNLTRFVNTAIARKRNLLVVVSDAIGLIPVLESLPRAPFHGDYDAKFQTILNFILDPLPPWLAVYCRPSQMRRLTGGAWWDEDVILVADEYYNHVIRLEPKNASVLLAGLDEPYHINLDRRLLSIANLGTNRIICGKLKSGVLAEIWELHKINGKALRRPHAVCQGNNLSIVADTDNHRVWWKRGHLTDRNAKWMTLDTTISFPCGVCGDGDGVWIADTFNHRVIKADHLNRKIEMSFGCAGEADRQMMFPISVLKWNDLLFIADEQNRRLQVCQLTTGGEFSLLTSNLAPGFMASPMGLSVNRDSKLLVTDRSLGCCWVVDLKLWRRSMENGTSTGVDNV